MSSSGYTPDHLVSSPPQILKYFEYEHLPDKLKRMSKPICDLAKAYSDILPHSAEKSAGLRKLLEAKDCFVRAALDYK